jgi:hypothetical protein
VAEVVQRLEGETPGHRAVTDHGDDVASVDRSRVSSHGEAVGVGEHGRGVAVLDDVVLALLAARITRQATGLAQLGEAITAPGQDFVDVGLMAGVPQDRVARGLEHPVEGD